MLIEIENFNKTGTENLSVDGSLQKHFSELTHLDTNRMSKPDVALEAK